MGEKSPKNSNTKKVGKSLKEKRADKKAKTASHDSSVIVPGAKH